MKKNNKNILVLCSEGLYQDYLINQLDDEFNVCGIVRHRYPENKQSRFYKLIKYSNPIYLGKHLYARLKILQFDKQVQPLIDKLFYKNHQPPCIRTTIPQVYCDDVNTHGVITFIKAQKPDLVCVNGTNLLRQPLLDLIDEIPFGIINLHTGLSPYSRGGNCNLYMLLEDHPELVGITVHHIDKGIDSGDILISARPQYSADQTYEAIDTRCFHLGVRALCCAARQLFNGNSNRIKQWLPGQLFLKRTGYVYQPYQRVLVNRKIRHGLIKRYLENRQNMDKHVKTVGTIND